MEGELAAAYRRCRDLHRRHGRSYYLATLLLPAWKRRHVHALYGFARYADDIVDDSGCASRAGQHSGCASRASQQPAPGDRASRFREWSDRFLAGLAGAAVDDTVVPAVLHTIAVFDLDRADFAAFLDSMAMDLTVTGYRGYDDLLAYMAGSAAAIGTMMLPILEPADPAAAREPARQLGFAFQLTNFIRDVAEDLGRGRLYLPEEDLERFGVSRRDLVQDAERRSASAPVKRLIEYEVSRARAHYAAAAGGVELLAPGSRACIRTAYHLYRGILDEIVRADHDVFARRAVVPTRKRLSVAARCLVVRDGRLAR